ncbi:hypothetical protein B0H10DRAFT_1945637 [Mycena sp. CBHHK59/15]|nr:hypothetical protein B0H10DRAFT_1945637 [Mycena sp. CBHHK59/15]
MFGHISAASTLSIPAALRVTFAFPLLHHVASPCHPTEASISPTSASDFGVRPLLPDAGPPHAPERATAVANCSRDAPAHYLPADPYPESKVFYTKAISVIGGYTHEAPLSALSPTPLFCSRVLAKYPVKEIEDTIRSSKSSLGTITLEGIAPQIWTVLYEKVSEELEYLHDSEILIVTWPSKVYEGFRGFVKPFIDIAQKEIGFTFETNIDIRVREGPGRTKIVVPDFAFGKKPSDTDAEYSIIVECACSQTSADLERKAKQWLILPKGPPFASPLPSLIPPATPVGCDRFATDEFPLLGPIEFGGHILAAAITCIKVTLYVQHPHEDVTPVQDDSPRAATPATGAVGPQDFDAIYPELKSFQINWEDFHADLHMCLVSDGHEQYFDWADKMSAQMSHPMPRELAIHESSGMNKQTREYCESGTDSDANLPPRVLSQPKTCKYLICIIFPAPPRLNIPSWLSNPVEQDFPE